MADLRSLPAVDAVLRDARIAELPRPLALRATRDAIDQRRKEILGGASPGGDVVDVVRDTVLRWLGGVQPVINATGVPLHTNLGRATWPAEAVAAAVAASGPCDVELDLETGARGGRGRAVVELLAALTGAEHAVIVNNCAAAVLLTLTALAKDREVVVSRGELVEIGGGFRVPDVISAGGARLVEVGTTNRTRAADYERAIGASTAALLRVHRSNFALVGFTEDAPRADLIALAHAAGLLYLEDAGSGSLDGEGDEPSVRQAVSDGADAVCFSGDKLLGGPQSGLIVGRREVLGRIRAHPLYRALRVDKVTLAALGGTLAAHARGEPTPADRQRRLPLAQVRAVADRLLRDLRQIGVPAHPFDDSTYVGGGTMPTTALPTVSVTLELPRAEALAAALRRQRPPIIGRIRDDSLVLDARTLRDEDVPQVVAGLASALSRGY